MAVICRVTEDNRPVEKRLGELAAAMLAEGFDGDIIGLLLEAQAKIAELKRQQDKFFKPNK